MSENTLSIFGPVEKVRKFHSLVKMNGLVNTVIPEPRDVEAELPQSLHISTTNPEIWVDGDEAEVGYVFETEWIPDHTLAVNIARDWGFHAFHVYINDGGWDGEFAVGWADADFRRDSEPVMKAHYFEEECRKALDDERMKEIVSEMPWIQEQIEDYLGELEDDEDNP